MNAEHFDAPRSHHEASYQVFTIELNGGQRLEIDYPSVKLAQGIAVFLAPGGARFCLITKA